MFHLPEIRGGKDSFPAEEAGRILSNQSEARAAESRDGEARKHE